MIVRHVENRLNPTKLGPVFLLLSVLLVIPFHAEAQARAARVHLEFEPGEDGSVVILRSDRSVQYRLVEEAPTRLVLELVNARPRSRNDLNPLVTSFFTTAVEEAKLESLWQGGSPTIRLVIDLSEAAAHRVTQQEDGIRVRVESASAAQAG